MLRATRRSTATATVSRSGCRGSCRARCAELRVTSMSLTLCVPSQPPPEYALQAAIVCVSACYPTCSSLQPYMMQVSAELGFANMLPGPLIAVAPELAKRTAPGPKPLVVHACTRCKTCLCSPGPNLNETLPRRAPAPLGVSASRPGDGGAGVCQHGQSGLARSSPCDTPPLQKPARARPLAQGHAAHPPLAFSRGALAAWMPKRGCGCGARAPAQSRRFHRLCVGHPGTRSGSTCLPSQPSSRRGGWLSCARATTPQ